MASVWAELKRRNVVRVAIAYTVVAWLLIQVIATVFPMLNLPDWAGTLITVFLIIGFPVALLFAWAYELTPEGIKKEEHVDRAESITHLTGRKLDFVIIGVLGAAVIYFVSEKLFWTDTAIGSKSEASARVTEETTKSIAVLPFVNMSGDADQEYFSDGITEEILNALAGIEELAVTSRTSAFAFKEKSLSIPEIAKELGVTHVLEGSVRKSGERLRITAQLIVVESDRHLWSETYDRELTDIFALQDEISANIRTALKLSLLGEVDPRSESGTVNPDAYDLYLHGLQQAALNTYHSYAEAESYFQQAIDIDPAFVRAYAALGWAYVHQSWQGAVNIEVNRPKVRDVMQRGLALDPDNAGLVGLSAQLALWDGDHEKARNLFRQALALEPPYYGAWPSYINTLVNLGQVAESLQVLNDWRESDPLNPAASLQYAFYHQFSGKFDAVFAATSHLKTIAPNNPYGWYIDGLTRTHYLGDLVNGILELEEGIKIDPNDYEATCILAIAYYSIGDLKSADAWVEKGRLLAPEATFVQAAEAYGLAIRGNLESARDISLNALDHHRQFDRWWGGFMTMRLAIDELIDRGEAATAVDMILEADPMWLAYMEQSPEEAPHLHAHPGFYRVTAWLTDYLADIARVLFAAGNDDGAQNVLAHMEAVQNWQREHGIVVSNTAVAELHVLRGLDNDALDALERAEQNGMIYVYWQHRLIFNRIFDRIREHPRFVALVQRVEAEMQRQLTELNNNRQRTNQIPL